MLQRFIDSAIRGIGDRGLKMLIEPILCWLVLPKKNGTQERLGQSCIFKVSSVDSRWIKTLAPFSQKRNAQSEKQDYSWTIFWPFLPKQKNFISLQSIGNFFIRKQNHRWSQSQRTSTSKKTFSNSKLKSGNFFSLLSFFSSSRKKQNLPFFCRWR